MKIIVTIDASDKVLYAAELIADSIYSINNKLQQETKKTTSTKETAVKVVETKEAETEAKAEVKPAETEAKAEAEVKPAETKENTTKISIDDIRKIMTQKNTATNRPALKEILVKYNATTVSELKEEDYEAVMTDLNNI